MKKINKKRKKLRSNDTVRIRPFTVTLRPINGSYTAVISGIEILSVYVLFRTVNGRIRRSYGENTDSLID